MCVHVTVCTCSPRSSAPSRWSLVLKPPPLETCASQTAVHQTTVTMLLHTQTVYMYVRVQRLVTLSSLVPLQGRISSRNSNLHKVHTVHFHTYMYQQDLYRKHLLSLTLSDSVSSSSNCVDILTDPSRSTPSPPLTPRRSVPLLLPPVLLRVPARLGGGRRGARVEGGFNGGSPPILGRGFPMESGASLP